MKGKDRGSCDRECLIAADLTCFLALCDVCCWCMMCQHDCHRTLVAHLCRRFRISHDKADADHPHHEPGTVLHAQEWLAIHQALHLSIQELEGGGLSSLRNGMQDGSQDKTNTQSQRVCSPSHMVYIPAPRNWTAAALSTQVRCFRVV